MEIEKRINKMYLSWIFSLNFINPDINMNDMAHRSAMDIRSKSEKTLGKRSGKTGNNKSVDTTLKSINTINAPDSMYIKFAAARRGFPKLNCVIALILLIPSLLFFYCFMNLCYLSHYTIFIVSMGIQKMEIQTGLKTM